MAQEGIDGEQAWDAWFPFLHLQHTNSVQHPAGEHIYLDNCFLSYIRSSFLALQSIDEMHGSGHSVAAFQSALSCDTPTMYIYQHLVRIYTLAMADVSRNRHVQEFDPAEIRKAFEGTDFPMVEGYLEWISGWLDSWKFQGEDWASKDPESEWKAYGWQLEVFRQKALQEEQQRGITPEQQALYAKFEVSPKGSTLCLLRE